MSRYVTLATGSEVLDVGCAVGTFLRAAAAARTARSVTGVDFKDLSSAPRSGASSSTAASSTTRRSAPDRFDLVTMWHFLEHDYDPLRSLRDGAPGAEAGRPPGHRGAAARQPHVPRGSAIAGRACRRRSTPCSRSRAASCALVGRAGFEVVDYLPYGAFPAYFYLFTGVAFRLLKGRGLNLDRAICALLRRPAARCAGAAVRTAPEPRDADGRLPEGAVSRARIAHPDAGDRATAT